VGPVTRVQSTEGRETMTRLLMKSATAAPAIKGAISVVVSAID
jgi:hypothetical protein